MKFRLNLVIIIIVERHSHEIISSFQYLRRILVIIGYNKTFR